MTWMKSLAIAGLALGLSGCFTSEDPLISRDGEDFPIPEGRYMAVQTGNPDERLVRWTGELSYRDGLIWSETPDAPLENGVFKHLFDNFYAVMDGAEADSYLYLLMWTHEDGGFSIHLPVCDRLSEESRQILDLERGTSGCAFDDWDQLASAMDFYVVDTQEELRPEAVLVPLD